MALPFLDQVATGQLTRTPFVLMDAEGNTQSHIWMLTGDTLFASRVLYTPTPLPAARVDPVESETGEQMNEWWILDPAGSPMARAHTPAGHRTIPPREGRVGRPTPRCTLPLQGRYVRGMWTDPARPANIAACHECGQGAPGSCPDLAARPAGDDS